jgi:sulfite exporter TauE/SafE
MLSSITPLGERGRGRRWATTAAAYLSGSVAGAAVLGTALGALGSLLPASIRPGRPAGWVAIAIAAALGLVFELRLGGLALPTIRRQVNENWIARYRGGVVGFGFGVQLGLGVVTIVTTALVYLTWVVAALSGSAMAGMAIGATFGLARALPVLAVRRADSFAELAAVHRRVARLAAPMHTAALAFIATLAVVAAAAAVQVAG